MAAMKGSEAGRRTSKRSVAKELEYIRQRQKDTPVDRSKLDASERLVGLAFSGGGIRSATTNLGIVQALSRMGILRLVDYLSTVSGGGYIGGCLTGLLSINNEHEKPAGTREAVHVRLARRAEVRHRMVEAISLQPGPQTLDRFRKDTVRSGRRHQHRGAPAHPRRLPCLAKEHRQTRDPARDRHADRRAALHVADYGPHACRWRACCCWERRTCCRGT